MIGAIWKGQFILWGPPLKEDADGDSVQRTQWPAAAAVVVVAEGWLWSQWPLTTTLLLPSRIGGSVGSRDDAG